MSDMTRDSAVEELHRGLAGHVESGAVPGLAWLVAHGGDVHSGSAGVLDLETNRPVTRRSIFRISSTSKPITAACAMTLVDDGVIGLDDPVTDLLPELSERTVLAVPGGPLDDTVPAVRDITLRDLLSFRMGLGDDFTGAPQPAMELAASLGPAGRSSTTGGITRTRTSTCASSDPCPWSTNRVRTGCTTSVRTWPACSSPAPAARASVRRCSERVLDPLGMTDTRFFVPGDDLDRFGAGVLDVRTANASSSTRPPGNGAPRLRSRVAAPASCRPSTTSWRSPR